MTNLFQLSPRDTVSAGFDFMGQYFHVTSGKYWLPSLTSSMRLATKFLWCSEMLDNHFRIGVESVQKYMEFIDMSNALSTCTAMFENY